MALNFSKNRSIKMLSKKNFFDFVTPQGVTYRQIWKKLLLTKFEHFFLRWIILKCKLLSSWQSYELATYTKMTARICSCVLRYKINCYDDISPSYAYKRPNFFGYFCTLMVSAFRSKLGRLNQLFFQYHFYQMKNQLSLPCFIMVQEKVFRFCNTLGCYISSNLEKITFDQI